MATTTATVTITAQYNVTLEQLDKADRVIDLRRNKVFYQVESQTDPTQDPYHVEFNDQFHVLTCNCLAGQQGIPCWHKRAALAAEKLYKAEVRRERQQEQAEVEETEAYQLEQAMIELEKSQAELDAYLAEVDRREAERKRNAAKREIPISERGSLNGNRGFSLLR